MKKYLENLKKVESDVFGNMGKTSQITIDVVQKIVHQLSRDIEEYPIQRDELGAINYNINVLLEIFNPELKYDVEILKRIYKIISSWYKDVEFINITLGIPRHKG